MVYIESIANVMRLQLRVEDIPWCIHFSAIVLSFTRRVFEFPLYTYCHRATFSLWPQVYSLTCLALLQLLHETVIFLPLTRGHITPEDSIDHSLFPTFSIDFLLLRVRSWPSIIQPGHETSLVIFSPRSGNTKNVFHDRVRIYMNINSCIRHKGRLATTF